MLAVASIDSAAAQLGQPRRGDKPGTERWIVELSGRSFVLRDRIAAIRAAPEAQRRAMIDALHADSRRDQSGFAAHAALHDATMRAQWWITNACVVEVPPAKLAKLREHAQVVRLVPDEERYPASTGLAPLPVPIDDCRKIENHNVIGAHALLPHKGAGATFALFDTGVDLDQTGTLQAPSPDLHRAFRDAANPTVERLLASFVVGQIDCNTTTPQAVDPWCPMSSQATYPSAPHGTGVAGIAVGIADAISTGYFDEGHAPGAELVSFSISEPAVPPATAWPTTASKYLAAIQALESAMLEGTIDVDVLNISYDGWADPDHVTQRELDRLEREFDVLVITSAGNDGDATFTSNGFLNGLSAGSVHKFQSAAGRFPHRPSGRGPLFLDPDRFYPDVCATGASAENADLNPAVKQIVMPLIDHYYTTGGCRGTGLGQVNYNAQGTSMAAPQVAGAAVLYRAERPSASAQETRAALLLATIDPFLGATSPSARQTYLERNATGVGYTRDDLVARHAKRLDSALGQSVDLTTANPIKTVSYGGLVAGRAYAVAIAWARVFDAAGTGFRPNVDLEVRNPTGAVLARSDSTRNTYERLVFTADGASVDLRVTGVELPAAQTVPVEIAARRIDSDQSYFSKRSHSGYVASIAQETTCVQSAQDQTVSQVVPQSYEQAYGSYALQATPAAPQFPAGRSTDAFRGYPLRSGTNPASWSRIDTIFGAAQIGLSTPSIRIRALALRSWRPFASCGGQVQINRLHLYARNGPAPVLPQMQGTAAPPPGAPLVSNRTITLHEPKWDARRHDTWPIIIPFLDGDGYFDLAANEHLGIWIEFAGSDCIYSVDGVNDGGTAFGSEQQMQGMAPQRLGGWAIVFGLIEGDTEPVTPELHCYGLPQVGSSLLFQVRQAGTGSPSVTLWVGATNPSVLIGPSRVMTSADLSFGPIAASPMGNAEFAYAFPNDPALLHQHLYFQGATTSGALLTNGMRLTIGGSLP